MAEFAIRILVPRPLTSADSGEVVLKAIVKHFPGHLPDRYGSLEPLRHKFNAQRLDLILNEWGHLYFMASGNLNLFVNFGAPRSLRPRHPVIALSFQSEHEEDLDHVSRFVYEICEAFKAEYAMAHILTQKELDERLGEKLLRPTSPPEPPVDQIVEKMRDAVRRKGFAEVLRGLEITGLGTHRLRKYLPDLYWLTVFGLPYVEILERSKLCAAPSQQVKELSYGGVAVKLTRDLKDTAEEWNKFKSVRKQCKHHLNSNVFFDPSAPSGHSYRVPSFIFPPDMYKQLDV